MFRAASGYAIIRQSVFYAGNLIGLKTDKGYIKYNFKDIVETSADANATAKMKEILFAVDTAEAQLLTKNRWAK